MERQYISDQTFLHGYDTLLDVKKDVPPRGEWSFSPNRAYDAYHRMHKVFVGEAGGQKLEDIAETLKNEWTPRYLNAAGWAAAEAALVQASSSALHRVRLIDQATDCWERALIAQEQIHQSEAHEWAREESAPYRLALNLAFAPLMKSLAVGNITDSILEKTFADTLAIAQAATVERNLAHMEGNYSARGDLVGFGHECNALLALLYMNDSRHIPLPSTARAGTGYEYRDQTHDIVMINQHWGDILKVVPIEIKARASMRDQVRYKALIIRGKMHLSVTGKHLPGHTLDAFAKMYEGYADASAIEITEHAATTMKELLQLYQQGKRIPSERKGATPMHFYEKAINL